MKEVLNNIDWKKTKRVITVAGGLTLVALGTCGEASPDGQIYDKKPVSTSRGQRVEDTPPALVGGVDTTGSPARKAESQGGYKNVVPVEVSID